jgi:hypothetical protein
LVATLIMLSLVTFMVVAFLGVARRERRSVEATITQGEARLAMEQSLARAQAEILARLLLTGDKWGYGPLVPTNYQNPVFNATVSPTNVNHRLALAGTANDRLLNIGNLQYDALVPVFSPYYTNTTPFDVVVNEANLGRWFLDLNRNGQFDGPTNSLVGDPPWIGVLENPTAQHSALNRFLSRYTYYVLPAGKALDLNLIHNQAKRRPGVTTESFYRNLGLGAHEMNLAAMLAELNPYWNYAYNTAAGVNSLLGPTARDSFGDARDLLLFRNNNSYNTYANLGVQFGAAPALNLTNGTRFDLLANGPLMLSSNLTSNLDPTTTSWPGGSNTSATAQRYFDLNELFLTTRGYSGNFTTNLHYLGRTNEATWSAAGDRNRRVTYDLFHSLGTESWPVDGKLNLNWSNAPYGTNITIGSSGGNVSDFADWHPDYFFYNAAELMLRASLTPVAFINPTWGGPPAPDVLITNYYFGTNVFYTNLNQVLSVTNLPIFPTSLYTPEAHRILQFAANLYDATTSNSMVGPNYPTLFRPLFAFNTNNWPSNDFIRIYAYTTNGTDTNLLSYPVTDLSDPNSRMALYTNAGAISAAGDGTANANIVAGIPVIIGAKKGFPNFNEFGAQSVFSATRRLEFVKTNATNFSATAITQTNQSLVIGLTNSYALEAWNSYAAAYPRPLQLDVSITTYVVVTNEFGPVYTNISSTNLSTNMAANAWTGFSGNNYLASFKGFHFANIPVLAATAARGYAYATNFPPQAGLTNGGFLPGSPTPAGPTMFGRSNGFPELNLGVVITNQLRYALHEPASGRVVDFVTLNNLTFGANLAAALTLTNGPADTAARFWDPFPYITNRSVFAPTLGVSSQIALCLDTNVTALATNQWRQWSLNTPVLREIDRFRRFLGLPTVTPPNQLPSLTTSIQSPFNPTRVVAVSKSWEVNDPLVHYLASDLRDPFRTTGSDQVTPLPLPVGQIPTPGTVYQVVVGFVNGRFQQYTNGGINRYYQPWGRAPDVFGTRIANFTNYYSVAPAAYDLRLKDAGIYGSDQWDFPQRKFANLGWIGRVHRGTPWQTFYLKSDAPNPTNWFYWARSVETNPTNDWRLVDIFSTAISADATRGLMSVNQTNAPAWAAALGGVPVLSNNTVFIQSMVVAPTSATTPQLANIVGGLDNGLINAQQRVAMWQPLINYSQGDVVGYLNGPYGFINYFRSVSVGPNQAQNPFVQVSAGNTTYWQSVPSWNSTVTYALNQAVVYQGVAYYSLLAANAGNIPSATVPSAALAAWGLYYPSRSFTKLGYVLSTPELSVQSPYLRIGRPWQLGVTYATGDRVYWQGWYYQAVRVPRVSVPPNPYLDFSNPRTLGSSDWWPLESPPIARQVPDSLSDVFIERIPQQTLGLLQLESSPRVVIYVYGQSLRPAERGVHVASGPNQGMATNYQITGESAARVVVRIDGLPDPFFLPRPLPAGSPPVVTPRMVIENFKLLPADY